VFHFQETVQYCRRSRGSAFEVLDHIITATDEELLDGGLLAECRELVETAVKLINGYIRYLNTRKRDFSVHEETAEYIVENPSPPTEVLNDPMIE